MAASDNDFLRAVKLAWRKDIGEEEKQLLTEPSLQSRKIDLCPDCFENILPFALKRGRRAYIKFHGHLYSNDKLFECISEGRCSCDINLVTDYFKVYRSVPLFLVSAAAAAGNFETFKLLAQPWLDELEANSREASGNFKSALTAKSLLHEEWNLENCLKKPGVRGNRDHKVRVSEEVSVFGESKFCDILLHSLYGGNDAIVHFLLERMSKIRLTTDEAFRVLDMTLRVGRDDMFLKMALTFGINLYSMDETTASTPLMLAVKFGRFLLVNTLLLMGADPLAFNVYDKDALYLAVESENPVCEMIARRLISSQEETVDGLMKIAMKNGHHSFIKCLIKKWRTTGQSHQAPFLTLVSYHEIGFKPHCFDLSVKALMSEECDINARCPEDFSTPLHMLSKYDKEYEMALLIQNGADVTAENRLGETPLYLAISFRNENTIASLIRAGCSLYCTTKVVKTWTPPQSGSTIFKLALEREHYNLLILLLLAGYKCSPWEIDRLLNAASSNMPLDTSVLISKIKCQPLPLTMICAHATREHFKGKLRAYLEYRRCPRPVRDYILLKHLVERFMQDNPEWEDFL